MRVVSFSLPKDIEAKVTILMESLQLRTGSIDFIFSRQGECVFLEVNPDGQYGYNSDAGNN
jgi:Holliday junction resolvase-like predicted endonuclease